MAPTSAPKATETAPRLSPDEQDRLLRLHAAMRPQNVARMAMSSVSLAASAVLVPVWLAALAVFVDHVGDRLFLRVLAKAGQTGSRAAYRGTIGIMLVGHLAYLLPALFLIASGGPMHALVAVLYGAGVLLHITSVLAVHPTLAYIALLSILGPLAGVNAISLAIEGAYSYLSLTSIAFLLLGVFAASVIHSNHRLNAALAKAQHDSDAATKARERLLAVMSHEMRTPLNAVSGITEALRTAPDTAPTREHLDVLGAAAEDMRGLVDDLLDLAAIDAGGLRIVTEPGNPRIEISRAIASHQGAADAKGLDFSIRFADDLPETAALCPLRLRQSVSNLLSNAIKYTETGHIAVTVAPEAAERLSITVDDTGPGIPEAARSRIFEPFARLDDTPGEKTLGVGLGLPITRELARRMGGNLTVDTAPNGGARFRLTICAPPCAPAAATPTRSPSPLPERLRVLVVDDLATNRLVAKLYLERLGAETTEAADGAAALVALRAAPFDAVLLDMRMPEIDGAETLARIRASGAPWSGIYVIAMTADAREEDCQRALSLGFNDYLAKPIDGARLRHALAAAAISRNPRPATTPTQRIA